MVDYENKIESLILSPEQRRQVTCILYEEGNEVRTAFEYDMETRDVLRYIVSLDRRKKQELECTVTMEGKLQANNKLLKFVFSSDNSELMKEFLMSFVKCNQTKLLQKLFLKMNSAAHAIPGAMPTNRQHGTNQSRYVQQPYGDVNTSSTASQATSPSMNVQETSSTRSVNESFSDNMTPEARLRQLEDDIIFLHGSLDDFARRVSDHRRDAQQRVFHS